MEDETKPQEGTETAPGAQQTDDAGSTSLEARMAVMEKELADARKENASWRRKLFYWDLHKRVEKREKWRPA